VKRVWPPPVAEFAPPELHQAILHFQRTNSGQGLLVDGHVDPGEACIRLMNKLAAAPGEEEIESREFSLMFVSTQSRDSALISCNTKSGTHVALYVFRPMEFGRALSRRLKANEGAVVSHRFTTAEPARLQGFTGPAKLIPLSPLGILELSQFRFTGNRRDGGIVQAQLNVLADGRASDAGTMLSGMMVLLEDKLAGVAVTPRLERGIAREGR
jgi:hypothetical protein